MPIFGVVINDDGEVLNASKAPHQAEDCDGLVYKATDENGQEIYLFLVGAFSQGEAVVNAQQKFDDGKFIALDPIWQPGSIWPNTADEGLNEQAVVQIYSPLMRSCYISTVPTHKRTNPFIDHFGENIMWAYMRYIEARLVTELTEVNERWKERRKSEEEAQQPVGKPSGTVVITSDPHQLMLDFDK